MAIAVLCSLAVLIILLIKTHWSPSFLFTSCASFFLMLGWIDSQSFLSSYSNSGLATLILILLVSLALEKSPLIQLCADRMLLGKAWQIKLKVMLSTAVISAFLNNTAVVAAFLGSLKKQTKIPAAKILIPLSYASILGGATTLIGTSTNLVVNSFVVDANLPSLGLFQFAWVGVPTALICIAIMLWTNRWLGNDTQDTQYSDNHNYFLSARVQSDSKLIGHTICENNLRQLDGLFLLELERNGQLFSPVSPHERIQENDVLVFTGDKEKLHPLSQLSNLEILGEQTHQLLKSNLVEVIVSHSSILINKTLQEVDFRTLFSAGVVAIRRGSNRLQGQLGHIPLKAGDSLLLAVSNDFSQHRNIERNFHIIKGSLQRAQLSFSDSVIVTGGFLTVISLAALSIINLFTGMLLFLGVLLLRKALSVDELRRRFPFDLLLIIGAALTIAKTLESSGAAALLANGLVSFLDGYSPYVMLIGLYLLTLILTEFITNNAAAALTFPIALSTAQVLQLDPMPFIMAIAYAASACFMFPYGYQTHLMVFTPGRYRLKDFIVSGLPVSIGYSISVLALIPLVFPFTT